MIGSSCLKTISFDRCLWKRLNTCLSILTRISVLEGCLLNSLPRLVFDGVELNGIYLTDTTLRDGQQGFGYFTVEESLQLYEVLVELNNGGRAIASTEVFLYTDKDRVVARRLLELGYEYPRVVGWIRASKSDLSLVSEARLEETVVLTSISDYHIYYKLGLSRSEALERYLELAEREGFEAKVRLLQS